MILSNAGFLSLLLGLTSSFAVFLCAALNIKKNLFIADKILAKHDENYMPPEVKESLEQK